jgi:hypothetical protein
MSDYTHDDAMRDLHNGLAAAHPDFHAKDRLAAYIERLEREASRLEAALITLGGECGCREQGCDESCMGYERDSAFDDSLRPSERGRCVAYSLGDCPSRMAESAKQAVNDYNDAMGADHD